MSALKKLTRQESIEQLKNGQLLVATVLVARPIQIGMRPMDNDEHYSPIFCGVKWVEEARLYVDSVEDMLKLVRVLKPVDRDYTHFFRGEFGASMIDYVCYSTPRGTERPAHQVTEIVINPYDWATPEGGEWTKIGPNYTIAGEDDVTRW